MCAASTASEPLVKYWPRSSGSSCRDRAVQEGWPWFVAFREQGTWFPGSNRLYWTFDELLRIGVLWGTNGGPGPIHIEMPTANRSEDSYPDPY